MPSVRSDWSSPVASVTVRVVPATADQDRAVHFSHVDCEIIVLADGAGGMTGGREAAERVVHHDFRSVTGPQDCVEALARLDQEVCADPACGESTAVVLVVRGREAFGASIGDSGVWTLTSAGPFDLTQQQHRKPLLGSGTAEAIGFGPFLFNDRILRLVPASV